MRLLAYLRPTLQRAVGPLRKRLLALWARLEARLWPTLQRAAAFCLPAAEGAVGRLRLLSAAPKSVYRF